MKDLSSTVRIGHSIVFGVFAIIALIEEPGTFTV